MKLKMYGGPGHGKVITCDTFPVRVEHVADRLPERPFWNDVPLVCPETIETRTYYTQMFSIQEMSEAGSMLRKTMMVLLLEGSELTRRELRDLERECYEQPWKWLVEPSFLYEFDKWWEWRLHVNNVKQVITRW